MFCINCGDELKVGARFCSNCGQRVREGTEVIPTKTSSLPSSSRKAASPSVTLSEPYEFDDVAAEEGSFIEVPDQKSVEILKNMLRQAEENLPEADRFPSLYLASVLELCNSALSIDPTYADFHVVKGDALVIARRFHEAIEEYDAACRLGATLLSIYNVKAYALAQKALILYILAPRNCEPWLAICDEVARLNPNVWQHYKLSLALNASIIRRSPSLTNNAFEAMGHEVKDRSPLSYGSQEYRQVIAKYPEYFNPAKDQ